MLSSLLIEQGMGLVAANADLLRAAATPMLLRSLNARSRRARRTLSTRAGPAAPKEDVAAVIRWVLETTDVRRQRFENSAVLMHQRAWLPSVQGAREKLPHHRGG